MDSPREKWMLIAGNLALKQVHHFHSKNKETKNCVTKYMYKNVNIPYICLSVRYDFMSARNDIFSLFFSFKKLQATVLGLLASLMASLLGWMAEGQMPFNHIMLLCSTSVSTAFVASLLQGKQ